jgi:phage recombination protein Bet
LEAEMERKRMKARSTKRVKVPRRKSKAIVRIPPVQNQSWDLNAEQVELVKKSLCPGATDEELKFCLTVAKRNKLDPFRRQIHFVPRGRGQEKRWVPIVGIDGLRHIAARDHRDYGSVGEPEYGPMITVKWTKEVNGKLVEKELKVPEWARVLLTKKGCAEPTVGKVYWEEIYPNIDNAPLVRQMPRLMLGKCAEAQGQRKAYPSTDGLYIPEEFYAARPEYTSEGREIVYGDEPKYVRKLVEDGPPVSDLGRKQLEKVERLDKEFASSSSAAAGVQSPSASNATQSGKVGVAAVTPATTAQPQGEGAKPSPGSSPPLNPTRVYSQDGERIS